MMKFRINQAKGMFFDRDAVLDAIDAAQAKVLPKAGGKIRTVATRSMRPAKQKSKGDLTDAERKTFDRAMKRFNAGKSTIKPKRPLVASNPGEPPRTRIGLIRKHLFFAYDLESKSLVVGPALLNKSSGAPGVLESGGATKGFTFRTITLDDGTQLVARKETTVKVAARPYMKPALENQQAVITQLFRDSVKG